FGARTRAALKAFQTEHGLGGTGRADPLTIQRLHAHVAGGSCPRVGVVEPGDERSRAYAHAGFDPTALRGDAEGWTRRALAILHIRAPLELRHGSPVLLLDGPVTALALDAAIGREYPSPLVVLEVPGGQAPLTQLLLRNAFAAELAA